MNIIKVILIDDHPIFRTGLASTLEVYSDNVSVCGSYNNGLEFINDLDKIELPDILIMDVRMPVMDGFQTLDQLKSKGIYLPVLILSMTDEDKEIVRMMTKGIRGFLPKDSNPELFIQALKEISKGGFFFSDAISGILNSAFVPNNHSFSSSGSSPVQLSEKEIEFIQLACSELTYKEIAERLFLSVKTIDGYRASLFEKLGVKSRPGLVLYAVKHGIFTP